MSVLRTIGHVLLNSLNFTGRADRREYWSWAIARWIVLFALLILSIVSAFMAPYTAQVDGYEVTTNPIFASAPILFLVFMVTLLPDLAVSVRRMHDAGRSGWWLLWMNIIPGVGFILLLALMLEGDAGANEFGPPPARDTAAPGK